MKAVGRVTQKDKGRRREEGNAGSFGQSTEHRVRDGRRELTEKCQEEARVDGEVSGGGRVDREVLGGDES